MCCARRVTSGSGSAAGRPSARPAAETGTDTRTGYRGGEDTTALKKAADHQDLLDPPPLLGSRHQAQGDPSGSQDLIANGPTDSPRGPAPGSVRFPPPSQPNPIARSHREITRAPCWHSQGSDYRVPLVTRSCLGISRSPPMRSRTGIPRSPSPTSRAEQDSQLPLPPPRIYPLSSPQLTSTSGSKPANPRSGTFPPIVSSTLAFLQRPEEAVKIGGVGWGGGRERKGEHSSGHLPPSPAGPCHGAKDPERCYPGWAIPNATCHGTPYQGAKDSGSYCPAEMSTG